MKKLSRTEFVEENKEFIQKVFLKLYNFIKKTDEIRLRSDEDSFRMDVINYLYNIYDNRK
jgi:hypothetical protein